MRILRASYLKQNIGVFLLCRPCRSKWRILANIGDLSFSYYAQVNAERETYKIAKIRHLQLQGRQTKTIEVTLRVF